NNLHEEILKNAVLSKWCPETWMRFGCSCYYKSTKERTWTNSRRFCQDKGADLVSWSRKISKNGNLHQRVVFCSSDEHFHSF
uniref:C-type lectin domain-containing protein n=1 Tax=Oryzias melastigma TaxID=30732 RepID=A0A3B3C1Y9_ORYME